LNIYVPFYRSSEEAFDGVFPRDNPKNARFAINFFTSIGLGGLT
jgi:pre-mRNA-splicing factor CWC22